MLSVPTLLLTLLTGSANAQGYSIDLEFVHATMGHQALPGMALPSVDGAGAFRYGTLLQYENDPLMLRLPDGTETSIVANRGAASLAASIDLTTWLAADLVLPTGWSWGTQIPELSGDGFGLGDLGGTVRLVAPTSGAVGVGMRLGATLPSGRQLVYLGEESPRALFGLLAMATAGRVQVAADVGVTVRENTATRAGFTQGDELSGDLGTRVQLTDTVSATAQLFSRMGWRSFLRGGAENAAEALVGAAVQPVDFARIDLGIGRGLTEGYGTTDLRLLTQLTLSRVQREPPAPEIVEVEVPVYIEVPAPPEPEPVVEEEEAIARVVEDQIVIRDRVEFVVDTNILLDASRPTLQAVAAILQQTPRIGHLSIVGHASAEGTYDHNYRLSESRARAIYEALVEYGVHPQRLTYRGMGEVVTLVAGEDEASLQQNRRVEFRIIKEHPPEDVPDYPDEIRLPWTGETVEMQQPMAPVEPGEE